MYEFRKETLQAGENITEFFTQKKVSDPIRGKPCAKNISDDVYIGGVDNDDHERHLEHVFRQLYASGLTINSLQCQFRVPTILFFGHVFSKKGMSPDPRKVESLQSFALPTNMSEV